MFVIYENISWKQSLETGFDRTCSGITVFINTFVGFILLMNNSSDGCFYHLITSRC